MAGFVAIVLGVLSRYAGGWGVPFFSFTTENGTHCRNDWAGYTCQNLTLRDVELFGEVTLPPTTRVTASRYHATHDYQLEATLLAPKGSQAALYRGLAASFGYCQAGHPSALNPRGLTQVCVMANDDTVAQGRPTSRVWVVGSGVRKDGSRLAVLQIRSR